MPDKKLILPCDCGGHHFLRFSQWDDETDLWLSLLQCDNMAPWWYRIKEAMQYILGEKLFLHEVVINKENRDKLKEFFQ